MTGFRTGYERQRGMRLPGAAPFVPFQIEGVSIPWSGVPMPGYLFRPSSDAAQRLPTVLLPGGFDSTAEEMYKYGAQTALEFGWNAVTWDGPGQGGMLVEHHVPMRPDFEAVLSPVVDWAVRQPSVDPRRLMLIGRSLGGYLAPRGASSEHRLAALVCDPGQFDFTSRFVSMFSEPDWGKVLDADPAMDASLEAFASTARDREFYGSRMAAMGAATFGEWLRALTGYTLMAGLAQIACPTLITEGAGRFRQPEPDAVRRADV